jgi:Tfp pilus assembly protein PilF
MNKILLAVGLLIYCGSCFAQHADNPLRDSLRIASRELSFHPDSVDLRLKKASWNLQLHEWNYAKDEYDIILKYNPRNLSALLYRAYVNQQLSRYNFARLDYQNLLSIVPGNFEAQLGLALLNEKDKHYTEAYDGMNRLISQYPDSAVAYAARGNMEVERNMFDLAEFDYTKATNLDTNNKDYLLSRADIYIRKKQKSQALADLDRLVSLGTPRASIKDYYQKAYKIK